MDKDWYLPQPLKDFHDQKDVFKCIQELVDKRVEEDKGKILGAGSYLKDRLWINDHVYTIDMFLWFMAQHGYTLQRNRRKINFKDIYATTDERRKRDLKALAGIFDKKEKTNDAE